MVKGLLLMIYYDFLFLEIVSYLRMLLIVVVMVVGKMLLCSLLMVVVVVVVNLIN